MTNTEAIRELKKFVRLKTSQRPAFLDVAIEALENINTFTGLKAAIDAGHGGLIQLGQEVTYTGDTTNEPIFECVDWDSENNRMTLLMKHIMATDRQFDAPEAFYGAPTEGLAAGNYRFTQGSTTYYFTLTQAMGNGAQLVKNGNNFNVYSEKGGTTISESGTLSTTAIKGATSLGTVGTGRLNHWDRVNNGSNDYGESALRQWLNASGMNWWQPKTMFDRPCDYAGVNGFMTGIPQAVLDVIDTTEVLCASQNTYCSPDSSHSKNSRYVCNDKFFLASQMEIYGSSDFIDNSKWFARFAGVTDTNRRKYRGSSAGYWWLRSPNGGACYERYASSSGSVIYPSAFGSIGVVVACKISKSSI